MFCFPFTDVRANKSKTKIITTPIANGIGALSAFILRSSSFTHQLILVSYGLRCCSHQNLLFEVVVQIITGLVENDILLACDILSMLIGIKDLKQRLPYRSKHDFAPLVKYSGSFSLPNLYLFYSSTIIIASYNLLYRLVWGQS